MGKAFRRYTPRQVKIMKEWYDHTGWEFQEPARGQKFSEALASNRRWLRDMADTAMRIGDDILSAHRF